MQYDTTFGDIHFEYQYDPRRQEHNIYVFESGRVGMINYNLVKTEVSNGIMPAEPFITMPYRGKEDIKNFLQKLVDFASANFQIVPSNYKEETSAQQKHLDDMRKIVGHELGVEL